MGRVAGVFSVDALHHDLAASNRIIKIRAWPFVAQWRQADASESGETNLLPWPLWSSVAQHSLSKFKPNEEDLHPYDTACHPNQF